MIKLSIVALLAVAASVQSAPPAERIVQNPLDGFASAHRQDTPTASIEEFIPQGETLQSWTRMVTVIRLDDIATRLSPLEYAHQFVGGLPGACPGAEVSPPQAIRISERQAARSWARCPRVPQSGLPESFYMVAIAGTADMYVVQIAFRRVPTPADLAFAAQQLESVRLCAAASTDSACRSD